MILSALEKVKLGRQLNSLVQDSATATGLKKIGIGREINAILVRLGYGAPAPAPAPAPVENEPQHVEAVQADSRPEVVVKFLSGQYISQPPEAFIKTITTLETFLDQFLTIDEVIKGSSEWVQQNHPEAA